ncbi:MAG: serine O-acetyltransferase EpsC, partial [Perlucidibaca sp.]
STLSRFWTGIEIHPGARIGRRFFIDHGMGVVIGETAEIGDDVTLYHGVTLGGTSWDAGKRHPTLEDGVVVGAGAKVLGPITIGRGAKIGSNAVVVKPVPEGASVVGPAGRIIVRREDDPQEQARRDFAARIGFQAYAANPDLPDPVLEAMRDLLDHLQASDARMDKFCQALKEAGINVCDQKPDAIRAETLATVQSGGEVAPPPAPLRRPY